MFRMKRWELALAMGLCFAFVAGALLNHWQKDLADDVLRLHVIANSDSEHDQAVKLKVRDDILAEAQVYLAGVSDVTEAARILSAHLPELEQTARATLVREGETWPVHAELTDAHFPTKTYDGFALPAGSYHALRVTLGEGAGQNWWCVVFPPLCVGAAEQTVYETAVTDGVSESNASLLVGEDETYVFKFKCLELWDGFKSLLGMA